MKEHNSRLLKIGESTNVVRNFGSLVRYIGWVIYVDSNNFLHNLNGFAWDNKKFTKFSSYSIHGKEYSKEQWDIERNRLLILDEIC